MEYHGGKLTRSLCLSAYAIEWLRHKRCHLELWEMFDLSARLGSARDSRKLNPGQDGHQGHTKGTYYKQNVLSIRSPTLALSQSAQIGLFCVIVRSFPIRHKTHPVAFELCKLFRHKIKYATRDRKYLTTDTSSCLASPFSSAGTMQGKPPPALCHDRWSLSLAMFALENSPKSAQNMAKKVLK